MGDRVAVMRDGHLQQVATPQELYDRPANDFVAGFIGSPPMNLLTTRVSHGADVTLDILGQTISVPTRYAAAFSLPASGEVTFGIRPEDIVIATEGLRARRALRGAGGRDALAPQRERPGRLSAPRRQDRTAHVDRGRRRPVGHLRPGARALL